MDEYIKRDKAIKIVKSHYRVDNDLLEVIAYQISNLPSADVQPVVHGEWIDMGDFEQCSVCTGTRLKEIETVYGKAIWIKTNWCPACGAKMDKRKGADCTDCIKNGGDWECDHVHCHKGVG